MENQDLLRFGDLLDIMDVVTKKESTEEAFPEGPEVLFYLGYSEPGYEDPKSGWIALANWNSVEIEGGEDNTMPILREEFEKVGVATEWNDEWEKCDICERLVRIEPNSYGWMQSWVRSRDGDIVCAKCACADEDFMIDTFDGNERLAVTFDWDPAEHGYTRVLENLENGFHSGMNSDPKVIAKDIRGKGVRHFIFKLDDMSQFYLTFSLYVRNDEIGLLSSKIKTDGVDVAKSFSDALQNLEPVQPEDGQIVYRHISLGDNGVEVTTKLLTQEEFIKGVK